MSLFAIFIYVKPTFNRPSFTFPGKIGEKPGDWA